MKWQRYAVAGLSFVVTWSGQAELRLPEVMSDHMVLQREKPLPLWGWAEPGQSVSASINGQSATAVAGESGKWVLELGEMSAGGPYELTVTAGEESKILTDVMVGEVWLCTGQSNMDMRLVKIWDDEKIEAELQRDGLRLFRVERAEADEPQDSLDGHWSLCEPADARYFSAVAYFMGVHLQKELGVSVGLIHTAYGGTPAEAWTDRKLLVDDPELVSITDRWDRRVAKYNDELAAYASAVEAGQSHAKKPGDLPVRYAPGGLYNAMLYPLAPYAVRGAVWYQGESNIWRAAEYRHLLTTMINNWRDLWGSPDMPFGVVQLASYVNPPRVPAGQYSWEELREAQLKVSQDLSHVGLAVTIDIGNPTDIHPTNKQDVGKRLALWALGTAYGHDIVYSGPTYTGFEIVDDKIYLSFEHVGSGLESRDGGKLTGFCIAGPDKKFRWAEAVIEGDKVVVSEKKVKTPLAVRYGWDDNPSWANLINREGLPASPFRTDDWPGITDSSGDE